MNFQDKNEVKADITNFVSSFAEHIKIIANISVTRNAKRYKKILYVTVLEGLAKTRYPSKAPRDRFVKLIHNYSGWVDSERISLPHLVAALERTPDSRFEQIRKFAYSKLRDWGSGGPVYLDKDPSFLQVQSLWPKENGALVCIEGLQIELRRLRQVEMIYEYRNYLVHESSQPTVGFEQEDDLKPFYESFDDHVTVFDNKVSEWHLVYPSGFLEQLCKCCLSSIEQYLLTNSRDPYESFKDGWYLVERLNNDITFPVVSPFYLRS